MQRVEGQYTQLLRLPKTCFDTILLN